MILMPSPSTTVPHRHPYVSEKERPALGCELGYSIELWRSEDYSLSLFNRFSITSTCLDRNDLYARRSLTCCVFVSASIVLIVRLNVSEVFSRVSSIVAVSFGVSFCTNFLVESTQLLLAEARSLRA